MLSPKTQRGQALRRKRFWESRKEEELVSSIRRGDERAFTEVYNILYVHLYRYAVRITKSNDLADDVVQDVFARLWRRRESWVVRDTIAACLHRAVKNRALDLLRGERRKRPPPMHLVPRSRIVEADEEAYETELQILLDNLLTNLSPRTRQVMELSLPGDLTYAEIGEKLGIARNTVRINLIIARRQLAQELRQLGWFGD